MNRILSMILTAGLLSTPGLADSKVSRFEQTYPADSVKTILVDNVFGPITLRTGADRVHVVAEIVAVGGSRGTASEALAAWPLVVEQRGSRLEVVVDSPTRCDDRGRGRSNHWHEEQGRVEYSFTIEVPDGVAVEAFTVEGRIDVKGRIDVFELKNVNSDVVLEGTSPGGTASSINGAVEAHFDDVPSVESKYSSINGAIDLEFPEGLDATFAISTMNGEIFSDFNWNAVELARPEKTQRKGARWVLRDAGKTGVRIGSGHTRIDIDSLNGDIKIRKGR